MTKEDAIAWLDENPSYKKYIETLERNGTLEKMDEVMTHLVGPSLVGIARAAGYKVKNIDAAWSVMLSSQEIDDINWALEAAQQEIVSGDLYERLELLQHRFAEIRQ
jgi:hypothetical protein